jgi:hypothetical protein
MRDDYPAKLYRVSEFVVRTDNSHQLPPIVYKPLDNVIAVHGVYFYTIIFLRQSVHPIWIFFLLTKVSFCNKKE